LTKKKLSLITATIDVLCLLEANGTNIVCLSVGMDKLKRTYSPDFVLGQWYIVYANAP
jgi:hypothetical protein